MSEMKRPDLDAMRANLREIRPSRIVDRAVKRVCVIHLPTLLAYAERLEAEVERLRGLLSNVLEASALAIESCPSPFDAMGMREVRDEVLSQRGTSIEAVRRAALNELEKTDD
jgi:hypothetical protein